MFTKLANPNVAAPDLKELDIEIPGSETAPVVGHTYHPFYQTKYFQVGLLSSGNPHAFRVSGGNLLYTLAYYDSENAYFCHTGNGGSSKYLSLCKSLGGVASDACGNREPETCFRLP